MNDIKPFTNILFEVLDPLGKLIRTTNSYWKKIKEEKHVELTYGIDDIANTIRHPNEIRKSVTDSTILLYYKSMNKGVTLVVVAKSLNGDGFVVTAYQTSNVRMKGEILWHR